MAIQFKIKNGWS